MMGCGSPPIEDEDEYEKLVIRMNAPRVTVDNTSSKKATLVKVDSFNSHGILLELVQVLTDLKLTIKRAYISSDGEWFMDVFHVVDQDGNKLSDVEAIDRIKQSLEVRSFGFRSLRRSVGVQPTAKHTCIELVGRNRPGLLSEVFAVLTDLKCNVVAAEVWTHNSRMASVVYVTDEATGALVVDPDQLAKIKRLLRHVLKGSRDKQSARTTISMDGTHTERRLHQIMHADRDYNSHEMGMEEEGEESSISDRNKPLVAVENCIDKGYTIVNVQSKDRPKLLFDTVCTLTDMQYVVFHATVIAEEPEAYQEYFIRHTDGNPVGSEEERRQLAHCLEAAIARRTMEGVRLELRCEDRVGLLSDVTRIFRENGLLVISAEVSTRGSQAVNVFYVMDASGNPVQSQTIEAVRNEIGETVLHVKDDMGLNSPPRYSGRFSFCNLFRSRSEKLLSNLGLIRSSSRKQ